MTIPFLPAVALKPRCDRPAWLSSPAPLWLANPAVTVPPRPTRTVQ